VGHKTISFKTLAGIFPSSGPARRREDDPMCYTGRYISLDRRLPFLEESMDYYFSGAVVSA
jgi:hypothetical protein